MTWVSFSDIKRKATQNCNRGTRLKAALVMTIAKGSELVDGTKTKTINFRLSGKLVDHARFRKGDRVDIFFDAKLGKARIIRDENGPMTLFKNAATDGSLRLSMRLRDEMPAVKHPSPCKGIEFETDGIVFDLPKDFYIYYADAQQDLKLVHSESSK